MYNCGSANVERLSWNEWVGAVSIWATIQVQGHLLGIR
jgi:hypothetical protein